MAWVAKRRAMLDVSIGWIGILLNFDCDEQFKTRISATRGQYLLTVAERSVQADHNDIPF